MIKPHIISVKNVYSGKVSFVDEYQLDFGNQQQTFELIRFDSITSVSALPIVDDQVILIKHYQLGINNLGWSLPTGGLKQGEDPNLRMQIELQEEIGFKAGKLQLLTRTHSMPGYIGGEPGYIYIASELSPSRLQGDEPFEIEVHHISLKKAFDMVKSQRIQDSRAALAISMYVATMA